MDIDEIVIENITRLMKAQGLNQKSLASNAKINYQNLNRLLKKKRSISKADILPDLAKYFGVTVTDLHILPESSTIKAPKIAEKPAAQGRDALLGELVAGLATLDESELRTILKAVNDLTALRGLASSKSATSAD